ncbi:MAG: DUF4291 family protein [Candidatus Lokiarchaeia archaeon]
MQGSNFKKTSLLVINYEGLDFMLKTAYYLNQLKNWPSDGRHILAQYDDESIFVYQAYRLSIACFAVENGFFGGEFDFGRTSWIKPGFLWMMFSSGWGTKKGQEVVLSILRLNSLFPTQPSQCYRVFIENPRMINTGTRELERDAKK